MATNGWGMKDFQIPGLDDSSNMAIPDTGGFKMPDIAWPSSTGMSTAALQKNAGTPSDWQATWLGGVNQDGTRSNGIIPTGLGVFAGLSSAYLGLQQLNLAKDQLNQNKKIFNLNFQNQAADINRSLEDRQRARVASNSSAYETVDSYMNKNKVSGKGL